MRTPLTSRTWKRFLLHIALPAMLVWGLFAVAVFQLLIPSMEQQLLDRKKEMIRELTHAAWSILAEYHQEETAGHLTGEEARREAAKRIEFLRYGEDGKDYFWITDMQPRMVVHPYRKDLNGQDLSDFEDQRGKKLFVTFVDTVREKDDGYVDYYWQWKDDANRIVPKLSYVRAFRPWNWVVGTGIYIEDVKENIARIERKWITISLAIGVAVALLLFYMARKSLDTEKQRSLAERALKESNEKYRALVEAATEGTLLVLEGKCAYSNQTFLDMVGFTSAELASMNAVDLLADETPEDRRARDSVRAVEQAEPAPSQFEARLRKKSGGTLDVVLAATPIEMAGRTGFILIAKDVARHKEMEAELDQTRRQFKSLTDRISLGVFRSAWGRKTSLLECNPAARRIFGLGENDDLAAFDWLDRVAAPEDRRELAARLNDSNVVEDFHLGLLRPDGSRAELTLFAALIRDDNGFALYCDGIVEDVTERVKTETEREDRIAQLKSSVFFLEEPIHRVTESPASVDLNQPISKAAALMTRGESSAALVTGPGGEPLGIVTDRDFRQRVVGAQLDPARPVHEIMSAPLATISEHALVYEAILAMREKRIRHLVVKGDAGEIKGIVTGQRLIQYQQHSSTILTRSIRKAGSVEEVVDAHERLPRLVKALIDSGSKARNINRIVTSVSDEIAVKLIALATERLGPPPARFAFLTLGSEGREEQTLVTDQDNGILYEDPPEERAGEAAEYFLKLGALVCDWLDQTGYAFCKGGVMAKNPRWCRPLSQWKDYFSTWIREANPQELLELNMFFDFRCVSGEREFADALRAFVFQEMDANPPFFLHFAQNTLLYKPPIGLFGNILVESSGERPKALDFKDAMLPIVNYARLYALKHHLAETHTMDRLARLHEKGLLSRATFDDLLPAYDSLMRMRLHHQALAIEAGRPADNWISPSEWTPAEEAMLKQAFSLIAGIHKKISYEFLGMA